MWKMIGRNDAKRLAGQVPTPGVAGGRDIRYADSGDPMHVLDVYYPEGTEGLLPVIFDIHGGGWIYGNKELNEYYCMSLASRGFAVVNISYRLLPQTDLSGQVGDVFQALHWLGANGADHHCDPDRVFLTGDSAGGHLASLAAAICADPQLGALYCVDRLPYTIKAVAATHTAPDVCGDLFGAKGMAKAISGEMKRMLFGADPEANPIYGKSTIYTTADPETYPPILVVTSEADPLYKHSAELIKYLEDKGFAHETAIADQNPDSGHVFNVTYPDREDGKKMNDRIAMFFNAVNA